MKSRSITMWLAAAALAGANLVAAQTAPSAAPALTADEVRKAIASQLPAPPAGFDWKLYKNAVLLKPNGWNEQEQPASTAPGVVPLSIYATSPEQFSASKQFEMGLTVTIISSTQRLRGLEARKAAMLYIKPTLDTHKKEEILMLDTMPSGDYERTVLRYRDAPPGLTPIIVHKFILANNVTDSVHVFTFESPERNWVDNWARYGAPVLSRLQVVAQLAAN